MDLILVRHLWGVDLAPGPDTLVSRWRQFGYGAIESPLSSSFAPFIATAREHDLRWVADTYTDGFATGGSVEQHLRSLREQVEAVAAHDPLLVNSHSGMDHWSETQMVDFFGGALDVEQSLGVPICHETHRRRSLATPWTTGAVLRHFPHLKLTADLSHWVCVTERLLSDFEPLLDQVARQTHHVHARVGFEHGPQVPDPRAPEWQPQLTAHERWWAQIWASQHSRGLPHSTLTPEFGPPPYLWTLPYTQAPLAHLDEICDWMARRQATAFSQRIR